VATRYRQPPVIEAIYEAHFTDAPGWSDLSYKQIEDSFRSRFGGQREEQRPVQLQIALSPGPAPLPTIVSEPPRIRLWTPDRGELVQFSRSMCAYNVLGNYSSFDTHVTRVGDFYRAFLALAQPSALDWASQHYINKIQIPENEEPGTFFAYYPNMPLAARRQFSLQAATEVFDKGEVVLNLSYRGTEAGQAVFFLEILARSQPGVAPAAEALVEWQTKAHAAVSRSFEAALTDKCRQMFERQEAT
jgi:uncharacterized protein (TIGR04255 family)